MNLGVIIETLKVAASIRLREFQSRKRLYRDFAMELRECAGMQERADIGKKKRASSPFFVLRKELPRCIVGITSDEGFLGEINTLVLNALLDNRKDKKRDSLVVLGERGEGYLRDMDVSFTAFPGISDTLRRGETEDLKRYLINGYLKRGFGEVIIVYPKFISVTAQYVEIARLLPCLFTLFSKDSRGQEVLDVLPQEGYEQLLMEPGPVDVMDGIAGLWIGYVLEEIFWSSKLSEFSARVMHLDSSEQELSRRNRGLTLEYFRSLHTLADKNIREVSASRFLTRE